MNLADFLKSVDDEDEEIKKKSYGLSNFYNDLLLEEDPEFLGVEKALAAPFNAIDYAVSAFTPDDSKAHKVAEQGILEGNVAAARALDSIGGMAYGAAELGKVTGFTDFLKATTPALNLLPDDFLESEPGTRQEMLRSLKEKVDNVAVKAEAQRPGGGADVHTTDFLTNLAAPMAAGFGTGKMAMSAAEGATNLLTKSFLNSAVGRGTYAAGSGLTQAVLDNPQEALSEAPKGAALGLGAHLLLGELPAAVARKLRGRDANLKLRDAEFSQDTLDQLMDLENAIKAKTNYEEVLKPQLDAEIDAANLERLAGRKNLLDIKATHTAALDEMKAKRAGIHEKYDNDINALKDEVGDVSDPEVYKAYKERLAILKEGRQRDLEALTYERRNLIDQQRTERRALANEVLGQRNNVQELKQRQKDLKAEVETAIKGEHDPLELGVDDPKLTPNNYHSRLMGEVEAAMGPVAERVKAQRELSEMNLGESNLSGRQSLSPVQEAINHFKSFFIGGSKHDRIGRIGVLRNVANFFGAAEHFANKDAKDVIRSIPMWSKMAEHEQDALVKEMSRIGMDYRRNLDRVAQETGQSVSDLHSQIHQAWKYGRLPGTVTDEALMGSITAYKAFRDKMTQQAIQMGADRNTVTGMLFRADDYITQAYSSHYFDDPEKYLTSRLLNGDEAVMNKALDVIAQRAIERGGKFATMSREALRNYAIGELKGLLTSGQAYQAKLRQPGAVPVVKGSQFDTTVKPGGLEDRFLKFLPEAIKKNLKRAANGEPVTFGGMLDEFLQGNATPKEANRIRSTFAQYIQDELSYRRKVAGAPKEVIRIDDAKTGAMGELTLTDPSKEQILYPNLPTTGPMYTGVISAPNGGGLGLGRSLMNAADEVGLPIYARAVAFGEKAAANPAVEQARLEKLYGLMGFERLPDPDGSFNLFVRHPRPVKLSEEKLQKLFNLALKEEDFPQALRAAMGEITDTDFLMTKGAVDMAHDTTVMKMYQSLRENAIKHGLASVGVKGNEAFVPLDGDTRMGMVQPSVRVTTNDEGDIARVFGGDDQGTIFVVPEVKKLMTAIVDRTDEMGLAMKLANAVKYGKVISPGQTVANFLSASISFAANDGFSLAKAMLVNPRATLGKLNVTQKILMDNLLGGGGELPKSLKSAMGPLAKRMGWDQLAFHQFGGDNEAIIQLVDDMTRRGVIEGGAGGEMLAQVAKIQQLAGLGDTARVHSEMMDLMGRFYQNPDILVKSLAYQLRLDDITKAEGLTAPTEAIKDRVAEAINNQYQTFSRTPEFAKMLSRTPLTAGFTTFPIEMVRNQINMLKQMHEYNSAANAASAAGDSRKASAYRSLTLKAATGFAGTVAGLNMMKNYMQEKAGYSDQTQSNIQDLAAPVGQDSSPLWISSIDPSTKEVTYLNLGRIHPFATTNALMKMLAPSNPRDWSGRVEEFVADSLDNFNLMGVSGKAVAEAMSGQRWNGLGDAFRQRDTYADNPNAPGVVDETAPVETKDIQRRAYRAWRNLAPSSMVKAENIYRGLTDNPAGSNRYDPWLEMQSQVSGMMPSIRKLDVALRAKLRPVGQRVESLRNDWKKLSSSIPPSDLIRYREAREAKQAELLKKMDEASFWLDRARGVVVGGEMIFNDDELNEYLKDAGFKENGLRNYLLYGDDLSIEDLWGDGE